VRRRGRFDVGSRLGQSAVEIIVIGFIVEGSGIERNMRSRCRAECLEDTRGGRDVLGGQLFNQLVQDVARAHDHLWRLILRSLSEMPGELGAFEAR